MYQNKTVRLKEIARELKELKSVKPYLSQESIEDVDDVYQTCLEIGYEQDALMDEAKRIREMSYVEFDKLYNTPEEDLFEEESKHGDEWEQEDIERGF